MKRSRKNLTPTYTALTPALPEKGQPDDTASRDDASADRDQLLDVSAPSWSGHYIQLEQEGKLDTLLKLLGRREKLQRDAQAVDLELSPFGDPLWLLQSYIRIRNSGARFGPELKAKANRLEGQKKRLTSELRDVEKAISDIDPLTLRIPASVPNLLLPVRLPAIGTDENALVLVRDYLIVQASAQGLTDKKICTWLDGELASRDAPPLGIPEDWVEDFGEEWKKGHGWNFYSAAYADERTKNRMQKMISKAKTRIPG